MKTRVSQECVKCGHWACEIKWVEAELYRWYGRQVQITEHLAMECLTCGYKWHVKPLDHADRKEQDDGSKT